MNEHVEPGAFEAVLGQELVLAELVMFGERGEDRLASDVRERHG